MNQKEVELEKKRMQINQEELIERMIRIAPKNELSDIFYEGLNSPLYKSDIC